MKKQCRDCRYELDVYARGCPRCAMNAEAEQMIERFIWRRLLPLLILLFGAGAVFLLRNWIF